MPILFTWVQAVEENAVKYFAAKEVIDLDEILASRVCVHGFLTPKYSAVF